MADIDYAAIEIPEDEPPEEYHYTARRAEILEKVREAGHPRALNQRELSRRYGCTPPNIHNDLNVLAEYLDNNLGARRAFSKTVFEKCIEELLADREWRDASRTVKEFNEFIDEYQWMENMEERLEQLEATEDNDISLR